MDSSRSGLLSTFLMTLPLIIVPAIALLRPPGQTSGISDTTAQGSESTEFEFPGETGDLFDEGRPEASSSDRKRLARDEEFGFSENDPLTEKAASSRRSASDTTSNDASPELHSDELPLPQKSSATKRPDLKTPEFSTSPAEKTPQDQANPPGPDSEMIVRQLNAMGAIRTMWFDASETAPVGFAAFFRGDTELMRYRFEAVGQTRTECAQDVLQQVTVWRQAAAQE